ncbi:GIY-YIG nuclease family protein [Plantibacter sp. 2H11-2]|uniref:GIY-YIG nuclease family protein n=1 Tax=Plantibacter sp. 2H11-2 TaxID=3414431 RepID=UPI003CEE8806
MPLTFASILKDAGIDPAEAMVLRHSYVRLHEESGLPGINVNSTDAAILEYTSIQGAKATTAFPAVPPSYWFVFIGEGRDRARLWAVLENRGEIANNGVLRTFDTVVSHHLLDLRKRLVIGWRSPRAWRINASTAADYPVIEIADSKPIEFPGFDELILDYAALQAVMTEPRYATWQVALSSVIGVYLITDTSDGRQYVGKADGLENIFQRWSSYAANGHGGNVELKRVDAAHFQFSLLRVFDPATPTRKIDQAERHFKAALDTRRHGLNRN